MSTKANNNTNPKQKYKFYEDAEHGWLEVERDELIQLGIADKITTLSYQKNDKLTSKVYLEEDYDAMTFNIAKGGIVFDHIEVGGLSHIRKMEQYKFTPLDKEHQELLQLMKDSKIM